MEEISPLAEERVVEFEKPEPQKRELTFKSFEFRGTGSEYFRIWIVNIALTILTLGIYSAWAKVRTNRYFYANTYLNGSNFEYNANPVRILIGRIVVIAVYALFILFSQELAMFKVASGIALVVFIAIPWLIRQAVSFKFRNTSYRHIPFRYTGKTSEFYAFFLLHSLYNIFTLFLIFPYSYIVFKRLLLNDAHYGNGKFKFEGGVGDTYAIYIQIFVWSTLFLIAIVLLLGIIGGVGTAMFSSYLTPLFESLKESLTPDIIAVITSVGVLLFYLPFIFWNKGFSDGYFSNFVRNKSSFHQSPLKGDMKPFRLGVISATNLLAIVFSLGLLYPWAKVRYLKYKLEHTHFACENYNQFESDGYEQGSTVGEEMVDFFDIDIGL